MKARLLCKFGEMKGSEFDIGAEATLGRSEASSIVLPSGAVSGEHARIFYDQEASHYVLEDLDSLNGTEVDGIRLRGRRALGPLHVVTLGRAVELIFVTGAEGGAAGGGEPPVAAAEAEVREATLVDGEPLPLPAGFDDGEGEREGERETAPVTEKSLPEITAIERDVVELPAALAEAATEREGMSSAPADEGPAEGSDDGA